MPDARYTTTTKLPVETIWDFVKDMDNWAEYVTGYQEHSKQSDTDSTWVLKGDLGVMARTLKFAVHITEWSGPERVRFELEGLNEAMQGSGSFTMERFEEGAPAALAEPRSGVFQRWFESLTRFLLRLFRGRAERGEGADAGPGAGMARLTFELSLEPGGPMAPMINAMMKPVMLPAAEDLASKIVAHLERSARA